MAKKKKYYAIKIGKGVNDKITTSWAQCKELVIGYPSVYKSFLTEEEAKEYLDTVDVKKVKEKTKKAMEYRSNTKVLKVRLEKELVKDFEKKCEDMRLTQEQILKGLLEEWLL